MPTKYIVLLVLILIIIFVLVYFLVLEKNKPGNSKNNQPLAPTNINQASDPAPKISFEKIEINKDWRLKESFDYKTYYGVIRNENELKQLWASMVNAYEELNMGSGNNYSKPIMSKVDFDKYSIIWYGDKAKNASFTTLNKVTEYDAFIEAEVELFYSDFGSSHLNLWKIPKTNKEIKFIETEKHESIRE